MDSHELLLRIRKYNTPRLLLVVPPLRVSYEVTDNEKRTKTTCVPTARAQTQLRQCPESLFLPALLATLSNVTGQFHL